MRADSTNWIRDVVRDAHFLSSWCAAAVHRHWEGWAPIRINLSTRDLNDTGKHWISEKYYALNSLNDNCECEGDVVSFAHGIILEDEVIPAAFNPHADRLLVQPLECPLIVPPFATGSVCSRFTVRAGHCSTAVANADMVLSVAERCWWWCIRRLPRCLRGSTMTATTLMAWSCMMAMGTGGRWSRTYHNATRWMSGWHRLVLPAAARS
ncbi:surface protease GP63 [Trypanosoma cruzi]|nr:surface protease GP63 [Trypanosoma cruzi]